MPYELDRPSRAFQTMQAWFEGLPPFLHKLEDPYRFLNPQAIHGSITSVTPGLCFRINSCSSLSSSRNLIGSVENKRGCGIPLINPLKSRRAPFDARGLDFTSRWARGLAGTRGFWAREAPFL